MGNHVCSCSNKVNVVGPEGDANLNRSESVNISQSISIKVDDNSTVKSKKSQESNSSPLILSKGKRIYDSVKILKIQKKYRVYKGEKISKQMREKEEEEQQKLEDNGGKSDKEDVKENSIKEVNCENSDKEANYERELNFLTLSKPSLNFSLNYNSGLNLNKSYYSNSIRSLELTGMDDKLKNIIQQLKKPYKLKFAKKNQGNKKEGFCVQEWEDGSILRGQYSENRLFGITQIITSDGKFFYGEFVNSKVDGYAVLVNSQGTNYEGFWENDQMNGICIESWRDGTYFQGEYVNGRRNGYGKKKCNYIGSYRLPDGTLYEGDFLSDALEGWGVMYFTNKNVYLGEWKDDKMHGYGEYHWLNGRMYIGEWEDDKKHGFGMHYWPNPTKVFVGFWANNKQNGVGCIFTSKLLRYGIWMNGERVKWLNSYDEIFLKLPRDKMKASYINLFPKNLDDVKNLLKMMR